MPKKRYIIVAIILLLLIAIFPVYRFLGANRGDVANAPMQTAQVDYRDLGETVLASGLISPGPGREYNVNSTTQGIVQEVFVNIGSPVEKGMLLMILENSAAEVRVEKAKGALRLVQIQLEELKKGPRSEEVARAQISLEQAEEALQRAEGKVAEWEALLVAVQAKLSEVTEDEQEGLLIEEKQLQEQLAALAREASNALTQYKLAKEQLSLIENKYTAADLEQAEIRVRQARLDVTEAELALAGLKVYAPAEGVVAAVGKFPGDAVSNGTLLFSVLDMRDAVVTAYIDETDIPKVQKGLEALVTLDAFPLDDFEAQVSHISPAARKEGNLIYYVVTLDLVTAPENLYSGMTADVAIYMDRIPGVLVVPSAAIRSSNGNTVVYRVQEDEELEEVVVTTGLRSAGWVEIVSGVLQGERVLTGPLPQGSR